MSLDFSQGGVPLPPPTDEEVDAAIAVLARTMRYSVKDNELDDWIA